MWHVIDVLRQSRRRFDHRMVAATATVVALAFVAMLSPAAAFPELAKRNGSALVILNLQQTGLDDVADLVLNRPIGDTLGAVVGVD